MRGNGVFGGFTKRITLLKQRNSQRNRAVDEGKGCFGDLQNEFRCKNNGIRGETVRRARKLGVLGIHKTNYVVKTTELGEETARHAQKLGVLGIHKTNSVVETTELVRKPRGGRGNEVFSGFTKRITLKNNGIRGETARQVRSANGKLCGRRHAVKKVCEKRKLDGRGGIIPTAERLRGKNYAPEKCVAEIRQAGNRGITLSESLRHHPQHMVDGNAAIFIIAVFSLL